MFEVGFTEIIVILGLALLVLGPEKLPDLARKVGRWTGRARSMARQLRTQLEQEVTLDELAKSRTAESNAAAAPSDSTTASPAHPAAEPQPTAPADEHSTHEQPLDPSSSETRSHDAIDAGAAADVSSEPPTKQQ